MLNNSQDKTDTKNALKAIGFNVASRNQINYDKDTANDKSHTSAFTIGTGTVNYKGQVRSAMIVVIRGTVGAEWYSNLDFVPSHDNNALYAENFLMAAQNIFETVENRLASMDNPLVLFTGHSRGAACADLLGLLYNEKYGAGNAFVYTYATPACIRSQDVNQNSANIFNIVNPADFIIYLPPHELGFFRPGNDVVLPDSNNLSTSVANLYSTLSPIFTVSGEPMTIQMFYETKFSLSKAGTDAKGKTVYEEIGAIADIMTGSGNMTSLALHLFSINSKSQFYPLRQFATQAMSNQSLITALQAQHEVATYRTLLADYIAAESK